jgi:hypothetical protein
MSIGIGVFANSRGRNGLGWTLLAMIASPLVGIILVFAFPNLKEQEREYIQVKNDIDSNIKKKEKIEQAKIIESKKIDVFDFSASFEKLFSLLENNILTESEFSSRKIKVVNDLRTRIISDEPDVFLAGLIPIYKKNIITEDELKQIKLIVYNN